MTPHNLEINDFEREKVIKYFLIICHDSGATWKQSKFIFVSLVSLNNTDTL